MVDFARLNEATRKRNQLFTIWIKETWPNGEWNRLPQQERDSIEMAFRRGFGQGFAEGANNG